MLCQVVSQNLNPWWNEHFVFVLTEEEWVELEDFDNTFVKFHVMDRDLLSRDDFIGKAKVMMRDLQDGVPRRLILFLEDVPAGRLHVSLLLSGRDKMESSLKGREDLQESSSDATRDALDTVDSNSVSENLICTPQGPLNFAFFCWRTEAPTKGNTRLDMRTTRHEERPDEWVEVVVRVLCAELMEVNDPSLDPIRRMAARKRVSALNNVATDPYCTLRLGGQQFSTKIQKGTCSPTWNEVFDFHIEVGTWEDVQGCGSMMHVELWGHNPVTQDHPLGNVSIALGDKLVECANFKECWYDLQQCASSRVLLSIRVRYVSNTFGVTSNDPSERPGALSPLQAQHEDMIYQKHMGDITATPRGEPVEVCSGFLLCQNKIDKKFHVQRTTKKRRFVIIGPTEVVYFKDEKSLKTKGKLPIDITTSLRIWEGQQSGLGRFPFSVQTRNKVLRMGAASDEERKMWTSALQATIRKRSKVASEYALPTSITDQHVS